MRAMLADHLAGVPRGTVRPRAHEAHVRPDRLGDLFFHAERRFEFLRPERLRPEPRPDTPDLLILERSTHRAVAHISHEPLELALERFEEKREEGGIPDRYPCEPLVRNKEPESRIAEGLHVPHFG